jgi:hypothetical protein
MVNDALCLKIDLEHQNHISSQLIGSLQPAIWLKRIYCFGGIIS